MAEPEAETDYFIVETQGKIEKTISPYLGGKGLTQEEANKLAESYNKNERRPRKLGIFYRSRKIPHDDLIRVNARAGGRY